MKPEIAIISTGGTIASTGGKKGASPSLKGKDLLDSVPGLNNYAEISVEQVSQIPSFDMDMETLMDIAKSVRRFAKTGSKGVVITHGTDTMEESAYFFDLTLDVNIPIIFTGAQRRPDEVSPDGPANILAAVRFAANDRLIEKGGVYISFNEELHAARDATKKHTYKLETFESPAKGPVARLTKEKIEFYKEPGSRSNSLRVDDVRASATMVKTGIGVDGRQVKNAIEDDIDGIVVEGSGLGNTTGGIEDSIREAIDHGISVVVTSRCHAGPVAAIYGGRGGGKTLYDIGAIKGGDLPAHKARIKLIVALSSTNDIEEIRDFFES